jgi:hypothetical protein
MVEGGVVVLVVVVLVVVVLVVVVGTVVVGMVEVEIVVEGIEIVVVIEQFLFATHAPVPEQYGV